MAFGISLPPMTRRHRHTLAVPLALVLALVPLADFGRTLRLPAEVAVVWKADDAERTVAVPFGRALLFPLAEIRQDNSEIVLLNGSVLFTADDIMRVAAGPWHIALLSGSAHITLRGEQVTVAAVSSPVVLERDGRHMIVPVGTQWMGTAVLPQLDDSIDAWVAGRTLLPLPEDFVVNQLRRAAHAPQAGGGMVSGATAELVAEFATLAEDTDLWLVTSMHPRTAGLAWVAGIPQTALAEDRLLRVLSMPRADTLVDPFPALAADRWFAEVAQLVPLLPEPDITLLQILSVTRTAAADATERGQPARAQRYRDLSDRLLTHFALMLTDAQRSTLPPDEPQRAFVVTEEAQSTSSQPSEAPASAEMLARVREALLSAGALYTAHTGVLDIGGDARITGIGFATPAGDTLFDFTLNLDALTVRDIRRNGETFVNEVTLEQFREWVGK